MAFFYRWFKFINLTEVPWRTFEDDTDMWSTEYRNQLKDSLPKISFPTPQKVTKGKIVLLGPIKSGKSAFINSILGVAEGRLVQKAPESGGQNSLTIEHSQFVCGNYLVCDTMGLEVRDRFGFNMDDIQHLLKGNIPKEYQFNPTKPITEDTKGFNLRPTNADRVHCVIFCVGADAVQSEVPPEYITKFQDLHKEITTLKIPRIMILTKIDVLCKDVNKDVSNTFKSNMVHEAVKKASQLFHLPEMYIHPVKNFTYETYPEPKKGVLLLLALKSVLEFAKDCIQEFDPEPIENRESE